MHPQVPQNLNMKLRSEVERQQAIHYIKGRLAKLSESRISLLDQQHGREEYAYAQRKVIDSKIDCLLDNLSELEKGLGSLSLDEDAEG